MLKNFYSSKYALKFTEIVYLKFNFLFFKDADLRDLEMTQLPYSN